MPTSIVRIDGSRIDPDVSVPTFAPQKLAAEPIPELEPPVGRIGWPTDVGRGSGGGSWGLNPNPASELKLVGMSVATQLASSVMTVFAMMTAPAARSRVVSVAS